MFRHKPPEPAPAPPPRVVPDDSVEARLRALGYLLDRRGYVAQGLCVLEVDDGFEVNALKVPQSGAIYGLVQQTETIRAVEITTMVAQLRATP